MASANKLPKELVRNIDFTIADYYIATRDYNSAVKYLKNGNKIECLHLNLENGLNLIKFNGEVFLIVEKTADIASYFAFV